MMPYTRSYGGDEVEIPAGGKLHLKVLDDDKFSASFEPRELPLSHNNTMRTWMDWSQRHVEHVYEGAIRELDGDKNITVSTEEESEVGVQQISAEELDRVTGGARCEEDRVDRILEGQDDRLRYAAIQVEGYGVLLEGEESYTVETVFPRDMIENAVGFICTSATAPPDYRPRHKPQLLNNIAEVLEE